MYSAKSWCWILWIADLYSSCLSTYDSSICYQTHAGYSPDMNNCIRNAVISTLYGPILHVRLLRTLYLQCVDKPTRCNTSYEWSLLSINRLHMFRTITSPSSGASSHKLYNVLVCSCYQVSLALVWMYWYVCAGQSSYCVDVLVGLCRPV